MFNAILNKSGLSLDRLQTLCKVAEKGSIGEATRGDSNKQSQYSRQIGELEKIFGIELLNRESRPYRLNPEAKELVKIINQFATQLEDFVSQCQNRPQVLTIGTGESTIQWILMPDLANWRNAVPTASINLKNLRTLQVVQELQDGEIDLGLIRKNAIENTSLKSLPTSKFSYRLFIPKSLEQNFDSKIEVGDIAGLPLAVVNGTGEFRSRLADLARESGCELSIELELSSLTQVANAIQSGDYCGFLPEFARTIVDKDADVYEVDGFEALDRELVFAWNPKTADSRPVLQQAIAWLEKRLVAGA